MSSGRLLALALLATLTACSGGTEPEDPADAGSDGSNPSVDAPLLPSSELGETTVGAPFQRSLAATGGTPPLTYAAQGLPAGLSLDARTGVLSGPPSSPGPFAIDVSVADGTGRSDQRRYSLLILEAPRFVTSSLAPASVSVPYSARFEAAGGKAPLTFGLSAGALPAGLVLEDSGALSGTPTAPGASVFEVSVTDAHGSVKRIPLALEVHPSRPSFVTAELPWTYVSRAYRFTLVASGGTPPYTWRTSAGGLPPGIALSSSGELSGTPSVAGTFGITFTVQDASRQSVSGAFSLTVHALPGFASSTLRDGILGSTYSDVLRPSGGKAPYSFRVLTGALPAGLRLSGDTLTGTPTTAGTASFTLEVRDANDQTGTQAFTLRIAEALAITSGTLPDAYTDSPYAHALTAAGGRPSYRWTLDSGAPPAGITLLTSGQLSGTPSAPGSGSFTARVMDADDATATRELSVTAYAPPSLAAVPPQSAYVSDVINLALAVTGGKAPYTFSRSGALPPGLSLDASTGLLQGTLTGAGSFSFDVTARDTNGRTSTRSLSFTVSVRPPDGSSVFTVGHWNVEWFGSDIQGPPRSTSPGGALDDLQIANAGSVFLDAGVNLWGLVEMVDSADFATLKAQLTGYDGFLSNDPRVTLGSSYYSETEQKLGVLYDSRLTFQSATLILTSASGDFAGRPPMRVDFSTRIHGTPSPLVIIVLHMKAFDDSASYDRRQRAGAALKNYLDSTLPSQRVLVVGDWNDDVDVSITRDGGVPVASPYENFVSDPGDYTFVTRPLSLAGERSTVSFPDMIDHTLVTNEVFADYVTGSARVLRPGWISDYAGTTSDHYPVLNSYNFGPAAPSPLQPSEDRHAEGSPF